MSDTIDITAVSKLKHSELWEAAKRYGSQSALAQFLGVSPDVLGRWINLKSVPGPRLINERGEDLDTKLYIATGHGMDELFPEALRDAAAFLALPAKTIEQRKTFSAAALEHYGEETAKRLEYSLPDLDVNDFRDRLNSVLGELSERERHVLTRRYGLDGDGSHTLREVAKEMGRSIERVRQIHNRAIEKLQSPNNSRRLVGYLP